MRTRPEGEFFVPGINPLIFREYDIRGVVEKDLTTGIVETIGGALGTHLGGAQGAAIAVGRDNRFSSPDFYDALQKGLTATGCRVIGIGMVPTPVVSFATHHLDVAGAVQITGSHNPPEFNGFKITRGHEAIHGAEIQEIRKIIEEGRIHRAETREERSRKSTSGPNTSSALLRISRSRGPSRWSSMRETGSAARWRPRC